MLTVLWQTKTMVSFPLEDKHVVNEHDATQEKCPHVVHFNVMRDLFETNSWHQTRYSEHGKNIFVGVAAYWEELYWAFIPVSGDQKIAFGGYFFTN